MLASLLVQDIVLIDRLGLDFDAGLTVLTGETGAGKSILLDALSLALGARGDQALVRAGAERGQVVAVFEPAAGHPVFAMLEANGGLGSRAGIRDRLQIQQVPRPAGRTCRAQYQRFDVAIEQLFLLVRERLELFEDPVELRLIELEAQLLDAIAKGMPAAVLAEHQVAA